MSTRPRRPGKPVVVPATVQGVGFWGAVFQPSDVEPLFQEADASLLATVDRGVVADALDRAVTLFIGASAALAADTPGDHAQWTEQVANRASALLDCFRVAADFSDPVEAACRVLRGPGGFIDDPGLPLDPRADVSGLLAVLQAVERRAFLARAEYEQRKGAKREMPLGELAFLAQLRDAYALACGRSWTLFSTRGKGPEGTAIRFCMAVGNRMEGISLGLEISRLDAVQALLLRLRSPQSIRDRLRDLDMGGKGRKR